MKQQYAIHENVSNALYDEVLSLAGASVFHTRHWHRVLERAFGWNVQMAVARGGNDELLAAMPFVRRRRMLLNRISVCLPMTDVAGPLLAAGAPPDIPCKLAERLGTVEIRHTCSAGFRLEPIYTRSLLDLGGIDSADELLKRCHKSSVQQRIRRASRQGVSVRCVTGREDYVQFGQLIAETRRKHGAPSFPSGFFREIHRAMSSDGLSRLYLAYLDDRCVAGQIFFHYGDVGTSSYSASVPERDVQKSGANQLVKWEAIRTALAEGMRIIDFGIANVQQPGLREYKEHWAAKSEILNYAYYPPGGGSLRIGQESTAGKLAKRVFSRLPMPVYIYVTPLIHKLTA